MSYSFRSLKIAPLLLAVAVIFTVVSQAFVLFPISLHVGAGTVPWLMGQGRVLYVTVFEHRPPVLAWIVAVTQPFFAGNTLLAVRALHLLTTLAILALIYAVSVQLSGKPLVGSLAVGYFAALQVVFLNVLFYFEMFQGLLYVAGVWCLLRYKHERLFILLAGVFFGLAFLTKQQAVLPAAFALLWVHLARRGLWSVVVMAIGAAAPILLTWALYAIAGTWDEYAFWNYTFNIQYASGGYELPDGDFIRRMMLTHGWIIPFAFLAIQERKLLDYGLVLGIGVLTLATQFPRSGELHAAAGLPFIAIQFGVVLATLLEKARHRSNWRADTAVAAGVVTVLLGAIGTNVITGFIPTPAGFRTILGVDEFRGMADWLRRTANEGDTLYVFPEGDSTAQLHLLTGMLPPRTWAIGNRWVLSPPFVIERLLDEWQTQPPTWIVLFPETEKNWNPDTVNTVHRILDTRYEAVRRWDELPFYGEAIILRFNG